MTLSDKEKLARLEHTFELNWKITRLYANYLEYFPELITKEMIDELTSDGRISKTDAVVAIICGNLFYLIGEISDENEQRREHTTSFK